MFYKQQPADQSSGPGHLKLKLNAFSETVCHMVQRTNINKVSKQRKKNLPQSA